jgi:sucrose phosphorylase
MGEADPGENVQLIAYADRFGGSLAGLHEIQDGPQEGLFAGVHVLPFFSPLDGADAGFDPVDHCEVDPPARVVGGRAGTGGQVLTDG